MTTVVVNAHPEAIRAAAQDLTNQGVVTTVTRTRNVGELRYLQVAAKPEEMLHRAENRGRFDLSDRQVEILGYLANGHTMAQIGNRLGLELSTVKTHLKRLYRRMGVDGLTGAAPAAVLLGYQHGYLHTEETTVQEGQN